MSGRKGNFDLLFIKLHPDFQLAHVKWQCIEAKRKAPGKRSFQPGAFINSPGPLSRLVGVAIFNYRNSSRRGVTVAAVSHRTHGAADSRNLRHQIADFDPHQAFK